jgi:hypothetical protein
MKKYSAEELMISQRKAIQRTVTPPGECIQGIYFSLRTGLKHFEASSILFEKNIPIFAYGHFITGIEELGRIPKFAEMLRHRGRPEIAHEYEARQRGHAFKLMSAFEVLIKMFENKSSEFKLWVALKDVANGHDPVHSFLEHFNSKSAEKYHELRMSTGYTGFGNLEVTSPFHAMGAIEANVIISICDLLRQVISLLLDKLEKFLPNETHLLDACYFETDKKKARVLKREINRRVNRVMPALLKCADEWSEKHLGVGIDEWDSADHASLDAYKMSDMIALLRDIRELFTSHREIEEIYFYPPLKGRTKKFYSKVSNRAPKIGYRKD